MTISEEMRAAFEDAVASFDPKKPRYLQAQGEFWDESDFAALNQTTSAGLTLGGVAAWGGLELEVVKLLRVGLIPTRKDVERAERLVEGTEEPSKYADAAGLVGCRDWLRSGFEDAQNVVARSKEDAQRTAAALEKAQQNQEKEDRTIGLLEKRGQTGMAPA